MSRKPPMAASGIYDASNRTAMEIILANPARFRGSALWTWAEIWRDRHADDPAPQGTNERTGEATGRDLLQQGSLFEKGDAA